MWFRVIAERSKSRSGDPWPGFQNGLLARLCPFWRGFEFISSAGPEDFLLFDDAEGVVERKNGAPEGTR